MIKNCTYDKVHSLDVADLGIVNGVLGQYLFKHLLESGVVGKSQALGMGAQEVFLNLGFLGFLDLFWQ